MSINVAFSFTVLFFFFSHTPEKFKVFLFFSCSAKVVFFIHLFHSSFLGFHFLFESCFLFTFSFTKYSVISISHLLLPIENFHAAFSTQSFFLQYFSVHIFFLYTVCHTLKQLIYLTLLFFLVTFIFSLFSKRYFPLLIMLSLASLTFPSFFISKQHPISSIFSKQYFPFYNNAHLSLTYISFPRFCISSDSIQCSSQPHRQFSPPQQATFLVSRIPLYDNAPSSLKFPPFSFWLHISSTHTLPPPSVLPGDGLASFDRYLTLL